MPKRDSVRVYLKINDPLDAALADAVKTVAAASGCGRAAAAKRLMTLGAFISNGYEARVITERMPKQRILWVDAIWARMRNDCEGAVARQSSDEILQPTPSEPAHQKALCTSADQGPVLSTHPAPPTPLSSAGASNKPLQRAEAEPTSRPRQKMAKMTFQ